MIALVEQLSPPSPCNRGGSRSSLSSEPMCFHQVMDVQGILLKFRKTLERQEKRAQIPGRNPAATIANSLLALNAKEEKNEILRNLLSASMHLALMLAHPFKSNETPQLLAPDSSAFSLSVTQSPEDQGLGVDSLHSAIYEEDFQTIRTFLGSVDLDLAQRPLQAALSMSPLYLLVPNNLQTNKLGRQAMFKAFLAVGNSKHPLLTRIECIIWRTVLDIARGAEKPLDAGKQLLRHLPWEEIEKLDNAPGDMFFRPNSPDDSDSPSIFEAEQVALSLQSTQESQHMEPAAALVASPSNEDQEMADAHPAEPPSATGLDLRVTRSATKTKPPSSDLVAQAKEISDASKLNKKKKKKKVSGDGEEEKRLVKKPKIFSTVKAYVEMLGSKNCPIIIDEEPTSNIIDWRKQFGKQVTKRLPPEGSGLNDRHTGKHIYVWNTDRERVRLLPKFHDAQFAQDDERLRTLVIHASKIFIDGRPLLAANLGKSCFVLIPSQQYRQMTSINFATILATKILIVSGVDHFPLASFDRESIATVGNLASVVSIIDFSHPAGRSQEERMRAGEIRNVFTENSDAPSSRSLLIERIPLPYGEMRTLRFASDAVAWWGTSGSVFPATDNIPFALLRWGAISTGNVINNLTIDGNGCATFIDVCAGELVLIVGIGAEETFNSIGTFLNCGFDPQKVPQFFDLETILVSQGSRIIIPPNTVHAVYMPRPSVALYGHFYITAALRQTLTAMVHSSVLGSRASRDNNPEARMMLRRMMHFMHQTIVSQNGTVNESDRAHIPDLSCDTDSKVKNSEVMNFLSLCVLNILSNTLDPRTYMPLSPRVGGSSTEDWDRLRASHDVNSISPAEREEMCLARAVALASLDWFKTSFTVNSLALNDSNEEYGFSIIFLLSVCRSLLRYKYIAERHGIIALGTWFEVTDQVINVIDIHEDLAAAWDALEINEPWQTSDLNVPPKPTLEYCTLENPELEFEWQSESIFPEAFLEAVICAVPNQTNGRGEVMSTRGKTKFDLAFSEWNHRQQVSTALIVSENI
ncbi:hypothetical protein CPB83DRAFT_899612 [Crepidotus variabilis]|uniref:JmjC domain-containing protein n=1 Tax=Crepidotus variabilis TaxID=179855 RepID=A0A9P6E4M1_9AGAR|nr:hypothetical protein CPB83DRAFT_899612 [Crepidotus variabilis]